MFDAGRLAAEFCRLAEISSPSLRERELADYLRERLTGLGLEVTEDGAGSRIGGNAGNIYARLPGEAGLPAVFFCAHMDTVEPASGVKVACEDGIFRSSGETVLGGDDKAGIAAIIAVLERAAGSTARRGTIEVVFTVAEEQGLLGSKSFDTRLLEARFGYVLDGEGDPGTIVVAAPAQNKIGLAVRGRAAHAGIDPEKGINAIQVAGIALARLRLGRLDAETTANIGVISGGKATNIVPDAVFLQGEARSLRRSRLEEVTREIVETFAQTAAAAGGSSEAVVEFLYPEFHLPESAPVVAVAAEAARRCGLAVRLATSGGGSDANIFNAAGIPTANLGIGMRRVHTTEEHLVAVAAWLWEIVCLAAEGKGAL